MTEFERMFQEMIDTLSPEELAERAIDAGFPVEGMLNHENEAIRRVARKKMGLPVE